jgi:NADPH-dependent 2,4-dienoyl-CoA reductase/sulfur reductase-like enzyme
MASALCAAPLAAPHRRASLRRHAARVAAPRCRGAVAAAAASSAGVAAPPARVAIVGAGVGGLSLAVALQKLCPGTREITIFETEADVAAERGAAFNLNGAVPTTACARPLLGAPLAL